MEQQNYFNELAEKMMKGEITCDQACALFKEYEQGNAQEMEALEDDLSNAEKEIAELKMKMEYLELNHHEVFDEVQKHGLDARCAECGYSTKGRKIRGVWDNVLCEDCGEHTDDDEE